MQNKDAVNGARHHIVTFVFLTGNGKHHAHEVGGIGKTVLRIDVRLADRVLVGHGDQSRHFGNHLHGSHTALVIVQKVAALRVERAHSAHQAR